VKRQTTKILCLTVMLILSSALGGCMQEKVESVPEVLRFSAIPDQSPERVKLQHELVVQQVCALAGLRCVLVPVPTYEELVSRLGRGEIDVAYLGAGVFAQAWHRYQVVPLAMRNIDTSFSSLVLVRKDDPARTLADLYGRKFSFSNSISASGHFMPRRMMSLAGTEAERDFGSVEYSANNDATMLAVQSGKVDGGVVNASVYLKAFIANEPMVHGLRVIWQSPPYVDLVWAARKTLPEDLSLRIQSAFLDLSSSVTSQRIALEHENAQGYVPAYVQDFEEVIEVVRQRGAL
jgi:phosphonate transport system substrate-binding protein